MLNSSILKNELIFEYAAGTTNLSKSLVASTYLLLNSKEKNLYSNFEDYCGEELKNVSQIKPQNLTPDDCFIDTQDNKDTLGNSPINKILNNLKELKWKKVFNGFHDYNLKLSDKESVKLIKMDPGAKVPLHSHNGKEYILVLSGSFKDEYGEYSKGNLQINDSNIKHTPKACDKTGCICLTVTEQDLVFYGPFAPILNIITFIKSIF